MKRIATVIAALGVLAACGSTAGTNGMSTATDELGGERHAATDVVRGAGTGTAGDAVSSARGAQPTGAVPGASPGGAVPAPVGMDRDGPIRVGIPHLDNAQRNALMGSVGFAAAGPEDLRSIYEHLIEDVNARGGILGHQVEPVFHTFDLTGNRVTEEQAACTHFTQDEEVDFVFSSSTTETFIRCIVGAGLGLVDTQWSTLLEADYGRLPGYYQPAAIALDRRSRIWADRLVASRFFESPALAKAGILFYDEPHFEAAARVLEASLTEHGVDLAESHAVHFPNNVDEVSQTASSVQGAVLRFRSEGVTHVLAVEADWFVTGIFAISAANQGYYPRYGLTSDHQINNLREQVPPRTLEGAQFVGWYPVMDVLEPAEWSAEAVACMTFLADKGEPMDTPQQRKGAVWACEALRYLEAALTAGGEPAGRDELVRGAVALGDSYRPTSTYAVRMTPSRGAGVARVRDGAYDTACSCFVYRGGPHVVDR